MLDAINTDNSRKNIKAIRYLKKTFKLKCVHIRCVNHIISLVVNKLQENPE